MDWDDEDLETGANIARILSKDIADVLDTLTEPDGSPFSLDNAAWILDMLRGAFDDTYVAACHARVDRFRAAGWTRGDHIALLLQIQTGLMQHLVRRTGYYLGLSEAQARVFLQAVNTELQLVTDHFAEREAEEQAAAREALIGELAGAIGNVAARARAGDLSARVDCAFGNPLLDQMASDLDAQCATVSDVLSDAVAAITALSEGQPGARMRGSTDGDFAALQDGINAALAQVEEVVGALSEAGAEIGGQSGSVAASSQVLSEKSDQQRSQLRSMSERMADLRTVLTQTDAAAGASDAQITEVRGATERVTTTLNDVMTHMAAIEGSFGEVVGLAETIDAIAAQTHLLSLNASVEAARAGNAGRGFGVVATEVRALATRVADAAGQVRLVIEGSTKEVAKGVATVGTVGEAMTGLYAAIDSTSIVLQDIQKRLQGQEDSFAAIEEMVQTVGEGVENTVKTAGAVHAATSHLDGAVARLNALAQQLKRAPAASQAA